MRSYNIFTFILLYVFYRRVDGNTTLVSEMHHVAEQTAKLFEQETFQVWNSDNFI